MCILGVGSLGNSRLDSNSEGYSATLKQLSVHFNTLAFLFSDERRGGETERETSCATAGLPGG